MNEKTGLIEIEAGSIDWEVMKDLISIDDEGNEVYSDEFVRINNIFVKKEFRGQGFARKMVETAIELIQKQYGNIEIKIVPEPKEESVDYSRLAEFYDCMGLTVVA